ncbi:T9SS type A sorting domain-containing protein [Lacinutrix sp. WUR7]|uniref:T9SS type A sorting domain-containing protein n=1 Tax=Lacinutrix sp. WUR7 TaxID=2653681 RepID=UPI00193CEE4C|nr:T9SS type A sorting domain-containing protein [Lacinutrix sp. WUR7]QRM89973.1 T9SS type A sorting domain-containing protein [Lacinutrix sp. WUR7]
METYSTKTSLLAFLLLCLSFNAISQNNSDGDDRMKIRLGFTSENMHRQILVTVDSNTTSGIDLGYDSGNYQDLADDMYWMIEDRKFLIQGTNTIDENTTLPLGIHTSTSGNNTISIEGLSNVPEDLQIGVLDTETNIYYNIKQTLSFSINLPAGEYLDRFVMTFSNSNLISANSSSFDNTDEHELGIDEVTDNSKMELNYYNNIQSISIKNIGNQNIKSVKTYTISGQQINEFNNVNAVDQTVIQTNHLSTGNYILMVTTDLGSITKKVAIR